MIALPAAANAATQAQNLRPPAASYTFGGRVYDRLFSAASRPRYERTAGNVPHSRLRNFAAPPYSITDLVPIAGIANREGASDGYGYPTAVNDSGLITYYDQCACTGNNDDIALLFNDTATYTAILYADQNQSGFSNAIPYAINASGDSAGEVTFGGPGSSHENMIDFSSTGGVLYGSGAADTTYALGVNDANTSVGHDTGAKGSFAAMFFAGPGGRVLLAPPKNVSWAGTATGINDSGEIVGYGTFATGGRALRFFTNKPAVVIPVGAAGVSTSAQAINVHGDIVGNAGNQAYIYHHNHLTYIPTPAGDTPGNAVAYAINASGEVVGDINAAAGGTGAAFLYSNGQSYDLNALLPANSGWQIVEAVGINATGQIVGMGYYAGEGGGLTPFSMKPKPASAGSR